MQRRQGCSVLKLHPGGTKTPRYCGVTWYHRTGCQTICATICREWVYFSRPSMNAKIVRYLDTYLNSQSQGPRLTAILSRSDEACHNDILYQAVANCQSCCEHSMCSSSKHQHHATLDTLDNSQQDLNITALCNVDKSTPSGGFPVYKWRVRHHMVEHSSKEGFIMYFLITVTGRKI